MTTKTGIIYLQKDRFQIYSPYLPNIYEFRFVPEIIKDFDMVNRELLENLLKVFIVNNKLAAITLIIVIADNAAFIKDFLAPQAPANPQIPPNAQPPAPIPPQSLEDLQNQANIYLDHVPFESVSSKTFPLANGVRAFATNEDIFNSIKMILEKMGFIVQGVLPGFAFGQEIANKPALDPQAITTILANLNTVQEYNLFKGPEIADPLAEENEDKPDASEESAPRDNKKIILAVAISGIVLIFIITGVVLYLQFTTKPYKPPVAPPVTSQVPVATPTSVKAAPVDIKSLTAQINSSANAASIAATLRSNFTALGFKSVVPQTQESLGASQNLLIFSSAVTPQTKTAITESVKNVVPDVLVQERADATFDVVVILAK